eukprot:889370_1
MSDTIEIRLRNYIDAFDGTKKDFSEVEHLWDAAYTKDFTLVLKDGKVLKNENVLTGDKVRELQQEYFSKGTKVTITNYKRIGLDTIYAEYIVTTDGEEDKVVHQLYTIEDDKIAMARTPDDGFLPAVKDRCKNFAFSQTLHDRVMGKFDPLVGPNMKGW